jgi:hypothetical protein
MKLKVNTRVGEIEIDDEMVVNPEDFEPNYNKWPGNTRKPFVIGHEFGAIAIVFASYKEDALDEAADRGILDCFKVPREDVDKLTEKEQEQFLIAGNFCDYFDDTYLWIVELPNPAFSFCALLEKELGETVKE